MIDLKEAQRIKDLVSEEPDRFEDIIESSSLAICVTDETGTFMGMNSRYLKLYGYKRDEMLGQPFVMVLEPDKRNRLQELHDIFMKLKDEIMRNWEVMRKDGSLMTITADAGYEGNIKGHEAKITFVWPDAPELQKLIS